MTSSRRLAIQFLHGFFIYRPATLDARTSSVIDRGVLGEGPVRINRLVSARDAKATLPPARDAIGHVRRSGVPDRPARYEERNLRRFNRRLGSACVRSF